jgi:hypothetical protein
VETFYEISKGIEMEKREWYKDKTKIGVIFLAIHLWAIVQRYWESIESTTGWIFWTLIFGIWWITLYFKDKRLGKVYRTNKKDILRFLTIVLIILIIGYLINLFFSYKY